jgi:ubiquinone/menaquinone biosynthesis C-methylase UbiE
MTYEPFSKEPEYIEANRAFVRGIDFTGCERLLDLACGTGTMTDLILELNPPIKMMVGVDISRESLLLAQGHFDKDAFLKSKGFSQGAPYFNNKGLQILLTQATAEILPLQDQAFDTIIMGNSIHLLPDEKQLLAEVGRVLRKRGVFAFNSSFYAGTMPKGTEKFNHEWVKQALAYLMRKDKESRLHGLGGISRKRGTTRRAFSKQWLSADEWIKMLCCQGLKVENVYERTVLMNQRCFETIGAYAGLASVLLSGYPVQLASEALRDTAGQALDAVGMEVVPRLWLEITATKIQ